MTIFDHVLSEAVQALHACGYVVEPWSNDYPLWRVDGETFTEGAVVMLALQLGLMSRPEQLQ